MIALDTHVLIWAEDDERRLGDEARAAIAAAEQADGIGISAITPSEIVLLAEKDRLRLAREVGAWIAAALALPGIGLIPIEPAIAIESVRLPGAFHADSTILSYAAGGHVRTIDALR